MILKTMAPAEEKTQFTVTEDAALMVKMKMDFRLWQWLCPLQAFPGRRIPSLSAFPGMGFPARWPSQAQDFPVQ